MKYWKIGSAGHALSYYAFAPNRDSAIKQVEIVLGGHNPSKLLVKEIRADEVPEDEGVFGLPAWDGGSP